MKLREGTAGRVQAVAGQYLAHPSVCCVCSRPPKSVDEAFLNLAVELDYYGCLYLCLDCANEIAESIGAVPYERHQELRNVFLRQTQEAEENTNQIAYLRGLLNDRIDSSRYSGAGSDVSDGLLVSEDESESVGVNSILDGIELDVTESSQG